MKITKTQLKEIIMEELTALELDEAEIDPTTTSTIPISPQEVTVPSKFPGLPTRTVEQQVYHNADSLKILNKNQKHIYNNQKHILKKLDEIASNLSGVNPLKEEIIEELK